MIHAIALIALMPQGNVQFFQLDLEVDHVFVQDSNYGMVKFDYLGAGSPLFLNVAIGDSWVIENIPLIAPVNEPHQLAACIPLPVENGQNVPEGHVWFSITSDPFNQPPQPNMQVQFNNRNYHIDTGVGKPAHSILQPRPLRWIDPNILMEDGAAQPVPNGETGRNECCPQSILNAMEWFRSRGIAIPPEMLTLLFWKNAVHWVHNPNGDPTAPDKDWDSLKKKALKGSPIKSRQLSISDWPNMAQYLKDGCAIEMSTAGHVMNVVDVVFKPEFSYTIQVSHDTKQGEAGGLEVEPLTFDVRGRILSGGGPLTNGKRVQQFVLQCPERH
jgi:hypothetical protein